MLVTATEAKNRFGSVCSAAKKEPVFVQKDGRIDTVILSADQFEALKATQSAKNLKKHKSEFENKYANWIKEMNQDFESTGHWCEDLRIW
jgi:prevent-host-death family protein